MDNYPNCFQIRKGFVAGGTIRQWNNTIDYVTIASTGNTTDFGDNTFTVRDPAGLSSPTRGIIGGGVANNNDISYVTIASEGNAVDFGDLSFVQSGTGANYGKFNS